MAYIPFLEEMGFSCRQIHLANAHGRIAIARFMAESFALAAWADVVLIQRVLLRDGFIDALRLINKSIVFDFDDAIYAPADISIAGASARQDHEILTRRLHHIFAEVAGVITGSDYLARYAKRFNANVWIIPPSVDLTKYELKEGTGSGKRILLGWTGSPQNLFDFSEIENTLLDKLRAYPEELALKIVSSAPWDVGLENVIFERWSEDREVELLRSFDVGLMPLVDTERSRGRCGYKAIQYMAVGIPVIASPVGAATEVVKDGATGIIAENDEEWARGIEFLKDNEDARYKFGSAGSRRVKELYSVQANKDKLATVLRTVASCEK